MLRKFLLPAVMAATLAGCATGYTYRSGNGDYYYGQPSVEYRYYGGYGPYGYGRYYGNGYYGSIGYGYSPYGYGWGRPYYGYPYNGWYRPLPPRGHGGHHDHDHDDDHDGDHGGGGHHPGPRPDHGGRDDKLPPWRNLGQRPRNPDPDYDTPGARQLPVRPRFAPDAGEAVRMPQPRMGSQMPQGRVMPRVSSPVPQTRAVPRATPSPGAVRSSRPTQTGSAPRAKPGRPTDLD